MGGIFLTPIDSPFEARSTRASSRCGGKHQHIAIVSEYDAILRQVPADPERLAVSRIHGHQVRYVVAADVLPAYRPEGVKPVFRSAFVDWIGRAARRPRAAGMDLSDRQLYPTCPWSRRPVPLGCGRSPAPRPPRALAPWRSSWRPRQAHYLSKPGFGQSGAVADDNR